MTKLRFLNSNAVKFLAAILMVIDHVGLLFFPYNMVFRYIGRLSMPLFAFAISEGCRYTKNKIKHLALLSGLALLCQIVYFVTMESLYMCILVTFSLSVVTIYALQFCKQTLFGTDGILKKAVSVLLFAACVGGVYFLCKVLTIDYGFWGCMMPIFASLLDFRGIENVPKWLQKADCLPARVLTMAVCVFLLYTLEPFCGYWALCAIPLLLLYNGEKGKWNTKYFFYIFYPTHLVILQAIFWLL